MGQNELKHYGVLGMKWGVRKHQETSRRREGGGTSEESANKGGTKSRIESSNTNSRSESEDISKISDEDLRKRVNRLNLEKQYKSLTTEQKKSGKDYVMESLDLTGDVLSTAMSAAAMASFIYSLRRGGNSNRRSQRLSNLEVLLRNSRLMTGNAKNLIKSGRRIVRRR